MTDDTDTTRTTYEEACLCPKCGQAGRVISIRAGRRPGVMLHMVQCVTELCNWFNTQYIVQVNEDGSVPQAYSQIGPKQFPGISQESASRIEENIRAQLEQETRGGGEIRNPHG